MIGSDKILYCAFFFFLHQFGMSVMICLISKKVILFSKVSKPGRFYFSFLYSQISSSDTNTSLPLFSITMQWSGRKYPTV